MNSSVQKKQGLIGLLLLLILVYYFLFKEWNIFQSLLFGTLFGFTLQRSRFCFVSCFRDPILFGNTRIANALLLSLAIMTVSFPVIQKIKFDATGVLVGAVYPTGIHTVVGALLFGFGMVIAGACASGTLMRIGEGYLLQILVLGGFVIGALLGAGTFEWWDNHFISQSPVIFLPELFGWVGAVLFQLTFLLFVYLVIKYYSKKRSLKI